MNRDGELMRAHDLATLLKDVGVDHSGGNIVVSEGLLNGADVGSALK
jgi:hypothetical protein